MWIPPLIQGISCHFCVAYNKQQKSKEQLKTTVVALPSSRSTILLFRGHFKLDNLFSIAIIRLLLVHRLIRVRVYCTVAHLDPTSANHLLLGLSHWVHVRFSTNRTEAFFSWLPILPVALDTPDTLGRDILACSHFFFFGTARQRRRRGLH